MPPNGPRCNHNGVGFNRGGAGSYHPNGVNVAYCDGSVRWMDETIDVGRLANGSLPSGQLDGANASNRSKFGVLGALATPASGEIVEAP